MLKNIRVLLILAISSPACLAAQPVTGGQLQIPSLPTPQKAVPEIDINRSTAPPMAAPDTTRIAVNRITVSGAKSYSEADLLAVAGFDPGKFLSLSELRRMTTKISDFYHRKGYFVAQSYLPAQDIREGNVVIAVVEGNYGQIKLNNQSQVSDSVAHGLLDGLNSGDSITSAPLEHRLLMLSDLPGVKVSSTLMPGATVGSSDLLVALTPGQRITGSVDADNAGNRYTGANRVGTSIYFYEPLGLGDTASLRALTSGSGLSYFRGVYQMQVGKARAGVAYSTLRYALGQEFEGLGANGTVDVASVFGSLPLIRSRITNLNMGLALDLKKYQDKVDSVPLVNEKTAHVLTASLSGDHLDRFGGGGSGVYSLALSGGEIGLVTPLQRANDAATAQTNGNFSKLAFSAARLQNVTNTLSVFASINGQTASKNLDVSEKMQLGGMYGVRAYPEGEAYADEGYLLSLEARLALSKLTQSLPGQLQLIGFIDTGAVTTSKNNWTTGANSRNLSGAGLGLNWSEANNFMVRMYYAFKLGTEVATSAPDASGRFWIQLVKYF